MGMIKRGKGLVVVVRRLSKISLSASLIGSLRVSQCICAAGYVSRAILIELVFDRFLKDRKRNGNKYDTLLH